MLINVYCEIVSVYNLCMELTDTREIQYSEYRELLILYIKQMRKTDELQQENTVLHNLVTELRLNGDNPKTKGKKVV